MIYVYGILKFMNQKRKTYKNGIPMYTANYLLKPKSSVFKFLIYIYIYI